MTSVVRPQSRFLNDSLNREGWFLENEAFLAWHLQALPLLIVGMLPIFLEETPRPWSEPVNLIYFYELMSRALGSWRFSKPYQMGLEENVAQFRLFLGTRSHLSLLTRLASLVYNLYLAAKSLMGRCLLQLWVLLQSLGSFVIIVWLLCSYLNSMSQLSLLALLICNGSYMSYDLNTLLRTGMPS